MRGKPVHTALFRMKMIQKFKFSRIEIVFDVNISATGIAFLNFCLEFPFFCVQFQQVSLFVKLFAGFITLSHSVLSKTTGFRPVVLKKGGFSTHLLFFDQFYVKLDVLDFNFFYIKK